MSSFGPPSFSWDLVSDYQQLTAFPFMVNALQAAFVVAVMAGAVGWFMVLRRESFAGHTLSLMAFPGATAATLIGLPAAAGYFAFCGAGALVIGGTSRTGGRRDSSQESAVTGTVQALAVAAGFLFLSLSGTVIGNYESLLFGTFLGITRTQVLVLAAVAAGAVALLVLAGRPLLFTSVDEQVASARGVRTRALSIGFLVVLGLAVAAAAQITGALLVFALLVAPPAAAQLFTARVGLGLLLSVAIGVAVAWAGVAAAYFSDKPVGFTVTTAGIIVYVVASASKRLASRSRRLAPAGEPARAPA